MKKTIGTILFLLFNSIIFCQIKVGPPVQNYHPRFIGVENSKGEILSKIQKDSASGNIFEQLRKSIDVYVKYCETDSVWMLSRLQMYWKTKSTEVFIKGGTYDHAEGTAPVPTVKFPGMRGGVSAHTAPKLEDILPYMDDPKGLYLLNKSTNQMEWVDISKTANIIEGINNNIMRWAYTASALYYLTGENKYAKFAFNLFDTYMTGMVYRKEPFDLSHGHHQTLAGLSSFEVIQEGAILNSLTGTYDFLYQFIQSHAPQKNKVYHDVFKKWADLQIAHGVAFNNWNLFQAKNVLNIALMLDDDKSYGDGKGNHYYNNYILNTTSPRQWSLQKVINEGFDSTTGLWNESAGYSLNVLNDVTGFISFFDKHYNLDLLEKMPVLKKATMAVSQYLFPNGYYASFGDSHYGRINLYAAHQVVANARKNKKPDQELLFTKYIKTIEQYYKQRKVEVESGEAGRGNNINALLFNESVHQLKDVPAGEMIEYSTPVFSSPHVSFFALRNSLDPVNGLMTAMSGSKGNHMHAGGISMEIYGKGYVLGPESGIGTNYFQADYAEYYSQFPAHNTVAVDGISAYPVMKSNHGFEVKSSYPASGVSSKIFTPVSFGNLYFLEPETNSDQTRLTSIIRTTDSTGYYIDIFRSKRKDGKDQMHDYFYHNMGQQLSVNDNTGKELQLESSDQLSFGGGHLFAYDYLYDKKSISTEKDINAVFKLRIPGKEEVQMNMWMKGEAGREIFSVKAPKSTAIDRMGLPKEIADLPMPTIVARQTGEAWTKPFAVLFEPSAISQPKSVISIQSFKPVNTNKGFVGLEVAGIAGDKQFIFSDAEGKNDVSIGDKAFIGSYGVISEVNNKLQYLFLGHGSKISKAGYSIVSKTPTASAALELRNNEWFFTSSVPVTISFPSEVLLGRSLSLNNKIYSGKQVLLYGKKLTTFDLPSLTYSKINFK